MLSIKARNVNDALPLAMYYLRTAGVQRKCRPNIGGDSVVEFPGPVATTYYSPRERVLWHPVRDANPFFHFFEALWIIAGRRDVAFLQRFNSKIGEVSDNGSTFHGAYGYRIRRHFRNDQLWKVVQQLKSDPDTRRAVLQIWDCNEDMGGPSKDIPCNDMVMLKVRDGALHITVCNRSNDIIWGCYGANVVQFSMLQEYIASQCGFDVGTYTQMSDSFHVYEQNWYWRAYLESGTDQPWATFDPYLNETAEFTPYPLFVDPEFDTDLREFMQRFDDHIDGPVRYRTDAFNNVVVPLFMAHARYHEYRDFDGALALLGNCAPCDWRVACGMWLARRANKAALKDQPRIVIPDIEERSSGGAHGGTVNL